jgi:dTDP-4-dehydrorhamnose reductase
MTTSTPMFEKNDVLVLGHKGMLGSQVTNFFRSVGLSVVTTELKWPDPCFQEKVSKFSGVVVNCAGAIPQSSPIDYSVNYELPHFILESGGFLLQPDTDCVFSGKLSAGESYKKNDKMDAEGPYAESKIRFINEMKRYDSHKVRVLRTSIVGFDKDSKSLLSWFLKTAKQGAPCQGYMNHMWNGVTTLEWAKLSLGIIRNWDHQERVTQVGTKRHVSKMELLQTFSEVFEIPCDIVPTQNPVSVNKCLESDFEIDEIRAQLKEFRSHSCNNESCEMR